jgi:hypothetical protein
MATLRIHSDDLDLTPPDFRVVRATTQPPEVTLLFDEPVDPLSALDSNNYALSSDAAIVAGRLASDQRTVTLALGNELTSHKVYGLSVQGVRDLGTPPNAVPQATSRDFVYEPALLGEDFSGPWREDWTVVDEGARMGPSSWETSLGRLLQCANIYGPSSDALTQRRGTFLYYARRAAFNWSNYVFSVVIHPIDNDGVGVLFRYQNPSNYYKLELDSERKFRRLYKKLDGVETVLATDLAGYEPNTDLPLEITAWDGLFLATLNDLPLFNGPVADSDRPLLTGTVALYSWGCQGVAYSNVVVAPADSILRVTLLSPKPGQSFTFQPAITLTAEVFDPANRLVALQFLDDAYLLGQVSRAPYALVWNNAPSGKHVLRVRGVQVSGLSVTSKSVPIQVAQPLELSFLEPPQAQSAWLGGEALFSAGVSGSQPLCFQWAFEGTLIPDATNSVLILRNLGPGQAGRYSVLVANPGGTLASEPALLSLSPAPATWEQEEREPRVDLVRVSDARPPVLRGVGSARTLLRLLVSDDLRHWTPLTAVSNAIGPFFYLDLEAASHFQRWYRLEQTP